VKNKKLIYGIIIAFVLAIFIWNTYQIQIQERSDKPIKLPLQISGKCGIENCHGLDITCGPNIPEICDLMYAAGDNCRQYASCQIVGGKCQSVKTPKFDDCKSCVEKCSVDFKDDYIKFFGCEGKCAGVPCGGWDTFGDVVCECVGQLEKYTCPPNTVCDSGTDTCHGNCGECKCYQGPAKDGIEVPCNGKDALFK